MQINSFEHGCEICGYDPSALPIVAHLPEKHQKAEIASYKLFVISEAAWKGDNLKIDWNDMDQEKWEPLFYMRKDKSNPTGFRLFVTICGLADARATGGSRLCYPSEEDAEYHANTHEEIYRDLMVIAE